MSIHAKKFKDDRGEYSEAVTVSLFLTEYYKAQRAMREATRLMLDIANNADVGYKPIHKRMVKLMRAWNQIEHDREKRPSLVLVTGQSNGDIWLPVSEA